MHVFMSAHTQMQTPWEGLWFYIHEHKFLSTVAFMDLRCLCVSVRTGVSV